MAMTSKDREVRIMVVGAGHMGANHIKKIIHLGPKVGARVSVVVDPDELRLGAIKREFTGSQKPEMISNLGQLSEVSKENQPDAAVVAVPSTIHVETAMACLAKGLHCLVEKPLGFSSLDVRELESQALKSKRLLQVGLLERWSLAHLWGNWKPQTEKFTIQSVRCGPFVPRVADTDVVHDLMIHDVDLFVLLDSIFNFAPIRKIRSWGRKLRSNHLDIGVASLDLEDGSMIKFFASRLSAESYRNWELTGPTWHASIDFMRRSLKRFEKVGRQTNAFEAKESHWNAGDPLGLEIEAFVKRVQRDPQALESGENGDNPFTLAKIVPSPENVIRTHEILDEILAAMETLDSA
jgi:UDP-N-acetylglucosamine 3-dehydrogenase